MPRRDGRMIATCCVTPERAGEMCCASIKRSRSSGAQTGWLVKGRVASLNAREALLIFCWNLLTTPSAPLRNGIFLLVAQPPLLENGGEWTPLATSPRSRPPRVAICRTVLPKPQTPDPILLLPDMRSTLLMAAHPAGNPVMRNENEPNDSPNRRRIL